LIGFSLEPGMSWNQNARKTLGAHSRSLVIYLPAPLRDRHVSTTDLCEALAAQYPEASCFAVPVNDTEDGYDYPPRVRFEFRGNVILNPIGGVADFLNTSLMWTLFSLQHEYGIYGGSAGSPHSGVTCAICACRS